MIPKKCKELIEALTDNGWNFVVIHSEDTGGSPYVNVEGKRRGSHLIITWHTRDTGTYRLFHAMLNKRDITVTKAMEAVTA